MAGRCVGLCLNSTRSSWVAPLCRPVITPDPPLPVPVDTVYEREGGRKEGRDGEIGRAHV